MKHEWKKHEKNLYLPKNKPEVVNIPALQFFSIEGEGNPNSEAFGDYIQVLYALSYGVRMSYKTDLIPDGYFDYTVYPLEGVWDIKEKAKKNFNGILNKDDLIFNLMIRQPDFVTPDFASEIMKRTMKKKPHELLEQVKLETIEEGKCIQMLHLGSYDNEPASFELMEKYAQEQGLDRESKVHREIYLTDARQTAPEKLKTVLRFKVDG